MSIYERLNRILAELPAIGKNQRNPQQGFMFRGHDDILNALNPLLAKHGVIVVPDVLERVTSQRETSKGGVMYEVNLHVRYRFYGADGDYVEASTWGEGTDMGDKATNKAMTMAFKNALNQTFAISSAEFKDADAETPEETQGRTNNKPPAATEAPHDSGQMAELKVNLRVLNEAYPEWPGAGRKWQDVAKGWCNDHADGKTSKDLSKAEMHDLNRWLEDKLVELNAGAEVPFT